MPKRARIWRGAMMVRPAWLEKNSARSMAGNMGNCEHKTSWRAKPSARYALNLCTDRPWQALYLGLTGALIVAGRSDQAVLDSATSLAERWQSGRMRRTRNAVYRQR